MIVVGLWLAIVGYGVTYAGVTKLGGGKCSLGDAFRGRCQLATSTSATGGPGIGGGRQPRGQTQRQAAEHNARKQGSLIGTVPIRVGSW